MPDRPLILSASEVSALRDRATTTLARPALSQHAPTSTVLRYRLVTLAAAHYQEAVLQTDDGLTTTRCPYGGSGTTLWVREGFGITADQQVVYRADQPHAPASWHSPIYMPRAYSRYRLTITRATLHLAATTWVWALDCRVSHVDPAALTREAQTILASMTPDERRRYDRLRQIAQLLGE